MRRALLKDLEYDSPKIDDLLASRFIRLPLLARYRWQSLEQSLS